ncbi:hypothetical protein [Marinisporobacter balticus]|uniref:Uncharacterized protein n=1 Tax=Marinisporobacter balticus TaxID=2018667 RepID=A0A4R2KGF9_9FIRM|nr:hypothetical protein [Marinisporobacter balticus]TCO69536.1 hypothetical protein EV214_13160 [Marinisporobacter balticus]
MARLQIGKNYRVKSSSKKKEFAGQLIGKYERFYLFQTEHYREAVLKSMITTGEYTVEAVKSKKTRAGKKKECA